MSGVLPPIVLYRAAKVCHDVAMQRMLKANERYERAKRGQMECWKALQAAAAALSEEDRTVVAAEQFGPVQNETR